MCILNNVIMAGLKTGDKHTITVNFHKTQNAPTQITQMSVQFNSFSKTNPDINIM